MTQSTHTEAAQHHGNDDQREIVRDNAAQSYKRITDSPQAEKLARSSSQNIEAVAQASTILTKGAQEISREWFDLLQQRLVKNIDATNRLAGCRSLQDLVTIQSDIVRDLLGHTVEGGRRIAEVSMRMADEADRVITSQADRNVVEFKVGSPRRVA